VTRSGTPSITTAQAPSFLASSGNFNGSTDYLEVPDHPAFALGANNYTIEAWVRLNTVKDEVVIGQGWAALSNLSFQLYYLTGNGGWSFVYSADGTGTVVKVATDGSPAGLWRHIAVCNSNGTTYFYLNGVLGSSWISVALFNSAAPVLIGAQNGSSKIRHLDGQLADVRITNGVARYPGGTTFTPPSAQLPDP
jgi:hypothetical protein